VQIIESDSLTEGYKNMLPLFHKLFLSGVEKVGETAGDWTGVKEDDPVIEIQRRSSFTTQMIRSPDGPITR